MNILDKRASNPAAALDGTELVYVAQLGADAVTTVLDMQTFITNGFLLITTAASTYQTLSGMSSYLTVSAAASTYQTQTGMSSYLTTANSRYQFVSNSGTTYTLAANKVTSNGRYVLEFSDNAFTSLTLPTPTSLGVTTGDSVQVRITGTYAAQTLVEGSGATIEGTAAFNAQWHTKTLIAKSSTVWTVVG